jgi:hypothetical protein
MLDRHTQDDDEHDANASGVHFVLVVSLVVVSIIRSKSVAWATKHEILYPTVSAIEPECSSHRCGSALLTVTAPTRCSTRFNVKSDSASGTR